MTSTDMTNNTNEVFLEVKGLRTQFFTDEGIVKAVDGADFRVRRGKTVCLVGESGCGKSLTARSVLQIVDKPGRIVEGEILLHRASGEIVDLVTLSPTGRAMRAVRGDEIAMVFQEPMSSLSPVHTIGNQIIEAIQLHFGVGKRRPGPERSTCSDVSTSPMRINGSTLTSFN